jgi:hypothetical protein
LTVAAPFDIRELVPGSENDEPRVQLVYDTVNRMVVLIGDVPFRRLFSEPLAALGERVLARADEAVDGGLLDDEAAVREAVARLLTSASELTVGELFCREHHHLRREVVESTIAVRRLGIQIPIPGRGGERRRESLRRLLRTAPEVTFKDLFVKSGRDVGDETLRAIHAVKRVGLLGWFGNDRCCAKRAGHDGIADLCSPNNGTWCNLTGMDDDLCSIGSDPCPPEKGSIGARGR